MQGILGYLVYQRLMLIRDFESPPCRRAVRELLNCKDDVGRYESEIKIAFFMTRYIFFIYKMPPFRAYIIQGVSAEMKKRRRL